MFFFSYIYYPAFLISYVWSRRSHLHADFFMICTLHQNIPFYILFPLMCFKQCFMKLFMIFSWFEVWYISSLNIWNNTILVLHVFKVGKCQTSNQEKIRENPLLVLYLFTGPIVLAKGMVWYNVQLQKYFFENCSYF